MECVAQYGSQTHKNGPKMDSYDVQQKLESVEEKVQRLCDAVEMSGKMLNSSPVEMSPAEALSRLQPGVSTLDSIQSHTYTSDKEQRQSPESQSPISSDQIERLNNAPIISLFKEAMLIQEQNIPSNQIQLQLSSDPRASILVKAIKALLPSPDDLELILRMTERFLPIWQDGQGLPINTKSYSLVGAASAKAFILSSIKSEIPVAVARATLFLALCIQQLPANFNAKRTNLPAPPKILLDSYIKAVDSLLCISESRTSSIDGIECLVIQVKLYINMGRPREAWRCIRHAFNLCLISGLHNPNEMTSDRREALWSSVWQGDKFISAILGLPAATSDSHPGLSIEHVGQGIAGRILYDSGLIWGHIIERNQNYKTLDYSATLVIDQELQQSKSRIPTTWWDSLSRPESPPSSIYSLIYIKLQYYSLCKMLHLPYMLKSSQDSRYEYSRLSALDACREMIYAYQTLRDNSDLALIICDLMDFQVFTGAVTLIVGLLSQHSQSESYQDTNDWALIHTVTQSLKLVSESLECTVARQAFQLLEHLSFFRHGTYSGPETYEVVIPMFGRVRIHYPGQQVQQESGILYNEHSQMQQRLLHTVQFSASSVPRFEIAGNGDVNFGAELGVDWMLGETDININYDWTRTFEGSSFG